VKKRKTTKAQNIPKWKQSQVKARRKAGAKKRPSRSSDNHFIEIVARFLVVCAVAFAGIRYIGIPIGNAVASHPIFYVREVVVEGARYLDTEQVCNLADIEMGVNIFNLDLAKVSQTLESEFTAEKFNIYRRLPYTVVIGIHERKPVALLNMKELVGVDSEGVPLPHIGADMIESLPIITGIKTVTSLSDSTTRDRLLSGLHMLDRISEDAPAVYSRISEVDVTSMAELGISLVDNGLQVIIGPRDWKQKIPSLDRIINEVTWRRKDVKAVDIRFGDKVIIKK
jgi:cell division septal protein FtsQ